MWREVGALLRREGLYSSSLSTWRRQGAAGRVGRNRIGEAWTEGTAEGCPGYAHRGIGTRDAVGSKERLTQDGNDHWHPKKSCHAAAGSLCRAWTTTSTTDGSGRDILSGCGNRRVMPSIRSRSFVAVSPPAAPANGGTETACIASGLERRERQEVLDLLHSQRFVDQAPAQVAAALLDEGAICVRRARCIESWMHEEVRERRNQRRHPAYTDRSCGHGVRIQVWSWDITKLKGPRKWTYFYLYVILDIFSRQVVGWMVADCESASLAKTLIRESCDNQRIDRDQLILHADRGSSRSRRPWRSCCRIWDHQIPLPTLCVR